MEETSWEGQNITEVVVPQEEEEAEESFPPNSFWPICALVTTTHPAIQLVGMSSSQGI